MDEIFFALCKQVDSPASLAAWLMYKYEEHEQLAAWQPSPGSYTEDDALRFAGDYCVGSFLSKWKGLRTGIDTKAVAIRKFETSEEQCLATNRRFREARATGQTPVGISRILHSARRKIASLLGTFDYSKVTPYFGWGPGATWDIPRRCAQVDRKIGQYPFTVSIGNRPLAGLVLQSDPHWAECILGVRPEGAFSLTRDVFLLTDTCRLETVPKNAKTDRVIAIEPTLNLFVQKGFGGYLRRRLKTAGVDLDNQEWNQAWASQALSLSLATLDLQAASDTVSVEVVFDLLPVDWALALDSARSKRVKFDDGSSRKLEKFSSMGNGFTFELESLIFWALTNAVTEYGDPGAPFSIYGDDIICSKRVYDELVEVLAYCGFTVNSSKSFAEGLFYESCGKHFFLDREVTPCYQKDTLDRDVDYMRCHNRLYRWRRRLGLSPDGGGCAVIARLCRRSHRRFRIPEGTEGDDGFLVSVEDFVLDRQRRFQPNRGWEAKVLTSSSVTFPGDERALLAHYFRTNVSPLVWGPQPAETAVRELFFDAATSQWSHGNVDVVVLDENRKVVVSETTRWIIPKGICPLPPR